MSIEEFSYQQCSLAMGFHPRGIISGLKKKSFLLELASLFSAYQYYTTGAFQRCLAWSLFANPNV